MDDVKVKEVEMKTEERCGSETSSFRDLNGEVVDSNGNSHDAGTVEKDDSDSSYVFVSGNDTAEVTDLNGKSDSLENVDVSTDRDESKRDVGKLKVEGSQNGVGKSEGDFREENLDNVVENANEDVNESNGSVVVGQSQPHAEVESAIEGVEIQKSDPSVFIEGEPPSCGMTGEVKEQTGESTVQVGESQESQVTSDEVAESEQVKEETVDTYQDGQILDAESMQNDSKLDAEKEVINEKNGEMEDVAIVLTENGDERNGETENVAIALRENGDEKNVEMEDVAVVLKENGDEKNGATKNDAAVLKENEDEKSGETEDVAVVLKENEDEKSSETEDVAVVLKENEDEKSGETEDVAIVLKENKDDQTADHDGDNNGLEMHHQKEQEEVTDEAPVEPAKDDFSTELKKELKTVLDPPTADANLEEADTMEPQAQKGYVDNNGAFDNNVTDSSQNLSHDIITLAIVEAKHDVAVTSSMADERLDNGNGQEAKDPRIVPVESCSTDVIVPSSDTIVEPDNSFAANGTKYEIEVENDASVITVVQGSADNDARTEPADGTKSEIETENDAPIITIEHSSASNDSKTEPDSSSMPTGSSSFDAEIAGYGDENTASVDNAGEETSMHDPVENDSTLNKFLVSPKPESIIVTTESENMLLPESSGLDSTVDPGERNLSSSQGDANDENGDRLLDIDSHDETYKEPESNDVLHTDHATTSSQEGSTADASEGQNAAAEVIRRPFYYMIRTPRFDDESLKAQINDAQLKVSEKTTCRDAIRGKIQAARTICREYGEIFNDAIAKEKSARELLKAKRKEIDAVQSMISRVKSAVSVEDIDARIRNMEHMMHHETLSLKEEKQFIRDIKQLKQIREQHSSTLGNHDEVQEALDQKEEVEDRIKSLRKEADVLREKLLKAEAATKDAKKKYNDENEKLTQLQTQFKAADSIRQEAYAHWQNLKKQLYEKNKNFWKYKDESRAANEMAMKGEKDQLQQHCINQVESVMELWKNDKEFREEYIRCNMRSTLRRLRTLDGRSLGPDEEPPAIPNVVNQKVQDNIVLSNLVSEKTVVPLKQVKERETPVGKEKTDDKIEEQKIQKSEKRKPAKPTQGVGLPAVSDLVETEEPNQKEHMPTAEEKKAEQLRKGEEAAKLREQKRLEHQAKSREGMERKRLREQKAREKALEKQRKEAEKNDRGKEKKMKKKEQKKAAVDETNSVSENDSNMNPVITESEMEEKQPMTPPKKGHKPSQFTKQSKAKSIPPPLRNRRKKRIQTWMWVLLTALITVALFLLGNSNVLINIGQQMSGL